MKRWFFGEKSTLTKKRSSKSERPEKPQMALDNGTVEEYVAYVRGMKSDVTANELQTLIAAFMNSGQRGGGNATFSLRMIF